MRVLQAIGLLAALVSSAHADSEEDAIQAFVDRTAREFGTMSSSEASLAIAGLCSNRWPSDFVMQERCLDAQTYSYSVYVEVRNAILTMSLDNDVAVKARAFALNDIAKECEARWADETGQDFVMTLNCVEKQKSAYDRIQARD